MRAVVTVAAIGHKLTQLPQHVFDDNKPSFPVHALLTLVGRGIAADSIDNHVNTFVLPHLIDDPDVVLLRVHPSQASTVLGVIEQSVGLRDRFESRAIGVLSLNDESDWVIHWVNGVEPRATVPAVEITQDDLVPLAQSAELLSYSQHPAALLPESDSFHYEAPNNRHYNAYFRASFAFTSRDSVDGLAFWIAPRIKPGSAIVLDSPGLLGVGLGIADYFRRELGCVADLVPSVEAPDFYGEDPALIASRLQVDAELERPVVILSSIISSGQGVDDLRQACDNAGFQDIQSLVLFSARGSAAADEALENLPIDLRSEPARACRGCLIDRKPVVPIRRASGLVDVSALVSQVKITRAAGSQASDFFSRYAAYRNVVSVHRDQHDFRRHHVIDISIRDLVAAPEFQERVRTTVSKLQARRTVILHPDHVDAEALGVLVQQYSGASAVIGCDPPYLGQLASNQLNELRSADLILIVDDVAITGSRLRQYRAFLNFNKLVDEKGRPEVAAYVGVLRPSSSFRKESIENMADRPTGLLFAEELLLPDWREVDCPWCIELKQIDAVRVPLRSLLEARRDVLRTGALKEELFLPFTEVLHPGTVRGLMGDSAASEQIVQDGVDAMELGPRSVFGDLQNESQVFVAVASALQNMRDSEQSGGPNALSETYTSPISRVLAPEYYLSGRFYAPVILSSILRAARRFDIRAPAIEPRLRQETGERFADIPELRAEMIYAMVRGVLPLASEAGDPAMVENMDPSIRVFLERVQISTARR